MLLATNNKTLDWPLATITTNVEDYTAYIETTMQEQGLEITQLHVKIYRYKKFYELNFRIHSHQYRLQGKYHIFMTDKPILEQWQLLYATNRIPKWPYNTLQECINQIKELNQYPT